MPTYPRPLGGSPVSYDEEIQALKRRVELAEAEVRSARRRIHDLANEYAKVQAEWEIAKIKHSELMAELVVAKRTLSHTTNGNGDNWPITWRHVLIASGAGGAVIGLLKLVGLLK